MVEFADIASFQAGADLAAYAHAGHDRILIKATEGVDYINPEFAGWWQQAGTLGLARGAYHFARPSRSAGADEADHFMAVIRSAGGLGPRDWLCLDAEDPDERGRRAAMHAADFCRRLASTWQQPFGLVYSGGWYLDPAGLAASLLPPGWRRLHLSDYSPVVDTAVPIPAGWYPDQIAARQFTDSAAQPGIPGMSDRSRVVRDWLPQPQEDSMPTAADVVDELERRMLAGMRLAEQPAASPPKLLKLSGTSPSPWEIIGRQYFKIGGIEAPTLTGIAAQLAAVGAALHTIVGPDHPAASRLITPAAVSLEDLRSAVGGLDAAEAIQLAADSAAHAGVVLAGYPGTPHTTQEVTQ